MKKSLAFKAVQIFTAFVITCILCSGSVFAGKTTELLSAGQQNVSLADEIIEEHVVINAENFPDVIFRDYIKRFDNDADGALSLEEIYRVDDLYIAEMNISSLKGIEFFTALSALWCPANNLEQLDITGNPRLEVLHCSGNQLSDLNISKNTALKHLYCGGNQLENLDVSNNINLLQLWFMDNRIKEIDLSKNAVLEDLDCEKNQLTRLDIANNPMLYKIYCDQNQLTELDISNNTEMVELFCSDNLLKSINVSNCGKLYRLQCINNYLAGTHKIIGFNPSITTVFYFDPQYNTGNIYDYLRVQFNIAADSIHYGDDFLVEVALSDTAASNAASLEFEFDDTLMSFSDMIPSEGVTILSQVLSGNKVKVVMMVPDYQMNNLLTLKMTAKADISWEVSNLFVASADIVVLIDEEKSILRCVGDAGFVPSDTGPEIVMDLRFLSDIIDAFGVEMSNPDWNSKYWYMDLVHDGKIDIQDIVYVATQISTPVTVVKRGEKIQITVSAPELRNLHSFECQIECNSSTLQILRYENCIEQFNASFYGENDDLIVFGGTAAGNFYGDGSEITMGKTDVCTVTIVAKEDIDFSELKLDAVLLYNIDWEYTGNAVGWTMSAVRVVK